MNNLVQNYEIILKRLQTHNILDNFHVQIRKPKLSGLELVALAPTAEYMSINSELQLFRVLKGRSKCPRCKVLDSHTVRSNADAESV